MQDGYSLRVRIKTARITENSSTKSMTFYYEDTVKTKEKEYGVAYCNDNSPDIIAVDPKQEFEVSDKIFDFISANSAEKFLIIFTVTDNNYSVNGAELDYE